MARVLQKRTIKDTSFHQLELLERRIPNQIKSQTLTDIRPMELQRFFNTFAETASKSYIDKMRVMINSLFEQAIDNELCHKNPMRKVKIPHVRERQREVYSMEEVRMILEYAMSYPNRRIGIAVMILLLTGIRRGELLGLRWSDVTDRTLTIDRAVYIKDGKPCVEEHKAKTASSLRTIPLLPELAYMIHTLPHYSEYIFGTSNGTLMYPRNFSRDFARFFRQLQKTEPSVRILSPHCCRHTFATLSLASDVDTRIVQEILGHADIKTTARYAHPDIDIMQQAMEKLRNNLNCQRRI